MNDTPPSRNEQLEQALKGLIAKVFDVTNSARGIKPGSRNLAVAITKLEEVEDRLFRALREDV